MTCRKVSGFGYTRFLCELWKGYFSGVARAQARLYKVIE